MNTIGAYSTDPSIPWAYFQSADYHQEPLFCQYRAHDWASTGLYYFIMNAYGIMDLLLEWDHAHRFEFVDDDEVFLGPNFVKRNNVEIYRAAAQHDWLAYFDERIPVRVSADPSHAHAMTNSRNEALITNIAYTPELSEKWVNFFGSAGVRYNLYTFGAVDQTIELYRVGSHKTGGTPNVVAWNSKCNVLPGKSGDYDVPNPQSTGLDIDSVVVEDVPDYCPSIAGIFQPSLTFTPKRSGWFYALVKGHGGSLTQSAIILAPAENQITGTSRGADSTFDLNREYRLGQTLPVSFAGLYAEKRSGTFVEHDDSHFWKFQHYPATRMADRTDIGDPTRPAGPFVSSQQGGTNWNMRYVIRVDRADDGTNLLLLPRIGRHDGSQYIPPNPTSIFVKTTVPGPQPGMATDLWTVSLHLPNVYAQQQPGEVLFRLFRGQPGTFRPNTEYDIHVYLEHDLPPYRPETDTSSFQGRTGGGTIYSSIYSVPRWCNGENIEQTLGSYQIAERIAPKDADYFQIWLEEGEHLNVTYRGKVPAAIDVDGPGRHSDTTMSETILNNFMVRGLWSGDTDHADSYEQAPGAVANDYRPVLTDPSQLECRDACSEGTCCGWDDRGNRTNEYFAQRGYLWNFNMCSVHDVASSGNPQLDLECSNTPWGPAPATGYYSSSAIGLDNALHLSLTAFISGQYTIRVRSQDDNDVRLDGYWKWPFWRGIGGAPYTLDFNLGMMPNPLRTHWQWLQKGEDPQPRLKCSRAGICGDGVVHPREECDDGNTVNGDGCDWQCFTES
ncbi:MAG: myxococcus cysteine-rich repeat containing protein [bacterium]